MNEQLPILHELCLRIANLDSKERLQILAEFFLNIQYGPWKNGSALETFDDFNYDLAVLDCVTYVEVVLALFKVQPPASYAAFVSSFEKMLSHIHYNNGKTNFISSNHFFCVDWIENNKYLVEDITTTLTKNAKIAETTIDKLTWFRRHNVNKDISDDFPENIKQKLAPVISRVPYIETQELLTEYPRFVAAFPDYSLVTLVRPNWDITERIGSHLNISHVGFAIKDQANAQLKFFHSTVEKSKVVQETLDVYMQRHQDSPTIRGFSVLAISPGFYHARQ